jgi:hypothetical protein
VKQSSSGIPFTLGSSRVPHVLVLVDVVVLVVVVVVLVIVRTARTV